MADARTAAFGAMICSGLTIAACLLIVPLIHNNLNNFALRASLQMAEFKVLASFSYGDSGGSRKILVAQNGGFVA